MIAAFAVVALVAVAITGALAAVAFDRQVRASAAAQEARIAAATVAAVSAAYETTGWAEAGLRPVMSYIDGTGAVLRVTTAVGQVVARSPGFAAARGPALVRPVMAGHRKVGLMTIRFGRSVLVTGQARYTAERWQVSAAAALAALLAAVAVSLAATRHLSAPLERVLAAMRARQAGDREARVHGVRAAGVIGDLADGFNASNDVLDNRDRAQRDLVADVVHEVRTPVAVLRAAIEAMLDGVRELSAENLRSLRDDVLRLARMIDDLQRLSAAESAVLRLALSPHDLGAIASAAAAMLAESFDVKGVRLRCLPGGVRVRCDEDRIREVVTNLLTNALKFTPAGGDVEIRVWAPDAQTAVLRVSDSGAGIPPDELPLVTGRFFRGRRGAAEAGGSGIGLAIVAELVRAHRGALDIASEPGRGTEVTVTLPSSG